MMYNLIDKVQYVMNDQQANYENNYTSNDTRMELYFENAS